MTDLRKHAIKLLRKYDQARAKLRELELELDAACLDYGRAQRMAWFSKDNLRTQLIIEEEQRLNHQADAHQWERAHD
jgi:hypothetical protein